MVALGAVVFFCAPTSKAAGAFPPFQTESLYNLFAPRVKGEKADTLHPSAKNFNPLLQVSTYLGFYILYRVCKKTGGNQMVEWFCLFIIYTVHQKKSVT